MIDVIVGIIVIFGLAGLGAMIAAVVMSYLERRGRVWRER